MVINHHVKSLFLNNYKLTVNYPFLNRDDWAVRELARASMRRKVPKTSDSPQLPWVYNDTQLYQRNWFWHEL